MPKAVFTATLSPMQVAFCMKAEAVTPETLQALLVCCCCCVLLSQMLLCNSHLLQHNALGVGSTGKRLLPLTAQVTLLVVLVCPSLVTAVDLELAPRSHTTCLTAHQSHTWP